MKSNKNVIFILVAIISLFGLIWFFSSDPGKKYNWNQSLDVGDSEPYGLTVFRKILKKKYATFSSYTNNTIRNLYQESDPVDYFAVGNLLNYKSTELDSLVKFAQRGNNIFLSFQYISDTALLKFGIPLEELKTSRIVQSQVSVQFSHPALKKEKGIPVQFHKSFKEVAPYSWMYLNPVTDYNGSNLKEMTDDVFEDDYVYQEDYEEEFEEDDEDELKDSFKEERNPDVEIFVDGTFWYGNKFLEEVEPVLTMADVAYINEPNKIICKRYQVGKGFVYILVNPILLSNFYCSNDTTRQVPVNILSHFNANHCILDIEATAFKMGSISVDVSNTPLRYILGKKWFKIGFYSFIACVLLFIILRTYRKQRAVPVFNLPENQSIEQIKNIAAVLYHDKDISKLERYLKESYRFWRSENMRSLNFTDLSQKDVLDRCDFLERRDQWDAKQIKEFQIKFYKLKAIYGN